MRCCPQGSWLSESRAGPTLSGPSSHCQTLPTSTILESLGPVVSSSPLHLPGFSWEASLFKRTICQTPISWAKPNCLAPQLPYTHPDLHRGPEKLHRESSPAASQPPALSLPLHLLLKLLQSLDSSLFTFIASNYLPVSFKTLTA